jgi:anaerobic ribonucleoside-triphosphate reductase activating protein
VKFISITFVILLSLILDKCGRTYDRELGNLLRTTGRCFPGGGRMQIKYAGVQHYSTVNGPGLRSVLWTQGCPIRCSGCFNRELWNFHAGMTIQSADLADEILGTGGIEGITFSGGEPFCQAGALAECAGILKEHDLNVVTFSGYSYDMIRRKGRKSWDALLGETDLLIAGPYIHELQCSDPLRSSENQELIHLSGILTGRERECWNGARAVEYTIHPGGEITITGFPDRGLLSGPYCREGDLCHISRG